MTGKDKQQEDQSDDFRFQELLQSVYEAILITDMQGAIVEANARAEKFFLIDRDELCTRTAGDLISGFHKDVLYNVSRSLEDTKHVVINAYCIRDDKTTLPAEIAVHKIYLAPDAQLCFSIRNITARKEAEKRLAEANESLLEAEKIKARMDTITTLAHEINGPLQMLQSMISQDQNVRYAKPLNRIVAIIQELRQEEELKTVSRVGTKERDKMPASDVAPSNKRRVLIVDDEITLQKLFESILLSEFTKLEIECAGSGEEALAAFRVRHHSVIVLDLSMPVMNGEEVFHEIQKICSDNKWEMPAIIFCTDLTPPESILQANREEPLHCCLPKPVAKESLINAVQRLLSLWS